MTKSIESIARLLRPLCLYRLNCGSFIDAELAAYNAGFALIENKLDTLWEESFIQTSKSYGLILREQMMQLWLRPLSNIAKRRELLIYRLAVAPNDYNLKGMLNSVRAAGLNAKIEEDIANERIRIIEDGYISDFSNMDEVIEDVRQMLPAHLDADFEIGNFTWNQFDQCDVTFDEFDSKDVPWAKLDIDGARIFEGGA